MKKYIFAVVAMLLMAVQSHAELKFGIRAGANITKMSLSSNLFEESNRGGFYVGPTIKFTLPVAGLGMDVSAIYDHREAKLVDVESLESGVLTYQAIEFPINLRYSLGVGSAANVFFFGGPQFGFNLNNKKTASEVEWEWKKADFSVNVGIGCTIFSHLEVRANYNIACTKNIETHSNYSSKFNTWQVGLAYYF